MGFEHSGCQADGGRQFGSEQLSLQYDNQARLNAVGSFLTNMTYTVAGQVSGFSLGNGVTESYGYEANRLQITTETATAPGGQTGGLMNLTYNYQASVEQMGAGSTAGNAGQLMAINNNSTINGTAESAAYTYDNLGRLVTSNQTSNGSSAQRRFAYDRWGNRTSVWDATNGGNQIQSITLQGSGGIPTNQIASVTAGSTVNYTYDAAGNVTNDGVHSYTYDSENRIVSVDSGSTASYAYDHQDQRYKKTIGSTVTHYVWEGSQVLAEHNGSTGAVLTDYVYSGSRMIGKVASGTAQYFLSDRLSERLVLDTSGVVLGRQGHLAFGEDFGESGSQEKHHFTSYERDVEAGTDYAMNRQYSAGLGRFLRADPSGESYNYADPQSQNRFSYPSVDPVNWVDPLGLDAEEPSSNPTVKDCQDYLGNKLQKLFPNNIGIPSEDQITAVFNAAVFADGDAVLLFVTWWYETNFVTPAPNSLGDTVYGPMQLNQSNLEKSFNRDFTIDQVFGDLSSDTFTGDVTVNIVVASRKLESLRNRVRKNFPRKKVDNGPPPPEPDEDTIEALTFAAYEFPAKTIGTRPRDLKPGPLRRYNVYVSVNGVFRHFVNCLKGVV